MPVVLLTMFFLVFSTIIGVNHIDNAMAASKQTWMQDQLDNAMYHASVIPVKDGLNEGVKEILFDEALSRFYDRLKKNGDFTKTGSSLTPGERSKVKQVVAINVDLISLEESAKSWDVTYSINGDTLTQTSRTQVGTGGELKTKIITENGETLSLPPKQLHGPAMIAVAYGEEEKLNRYTGPTRIPVISIQHIAK
ncbi:hypothetical protein GPJ61_27665 [Brevibacillus formosus]|uniref:hypothetical protein n=1 Tax=Brevibacillus formosus TaxID=54913 RepID=UPI001CA5AD6A|nr:hypothetical protein [Brevibacillus formosus]MBW5471569.1 hypothetical protein [Brevibacillus formosus]